MELSNKKINNIEEGKNENKCEKIGDFVVLLDKKFLSKLKFSKRFLGFLYPTKNYKIS